MNIQNLRSVLIGQPKVAHGTIWTIVDISYAPMHNCVEILYIAGDTYRIERFDIHSISYKPIEFFQKLFCDSKILETRLYRLIA